jgi:hypothetical protein
MSIVKNKILYSHKKSKSKSKKKNFGHKSDSLISGLISIRNYFNSLDFATGGLLKFLTAAYGAKKANDIWRWYKEKETFSDAPPYTIKSNSVSEAIKKINKLIYGHEDTEYIVGKANDGTNLIVAHKPISNYKNNLSNINAITYRLNEIDNIYTNSKKEPFFSPLSAAYVSEHIIEDGILKYKPYPKHPEKTTITVSGAGVGKQFGKRRSHKRRSHKRRSHKK